MKCNFFSSLHTKMSPANFTIPNHLHRFITQTDVWNLYLTSMKITDTSCKKKNNNKYISTIPTNIHNTWCHISCNINNAEGKQKIDAVKKTQKPWKILHINLRVNQHILRLINSLRLWLRTLRLKYYWPFKCFSKKFIICGQSGYCDKTETDRLDHKIIRAACFSLTCYENLTQILSFWFWLQWFVTMLMVFCHFGSQKISKNIRTQSPCCE